MSRTDHHQPYWVRTLHAHTDGRRTTIRHDAHCVEYRGFRYDGTGFATGPAPIRIMNVPLAEAEANGWHIYPAWTYTHPNGVVTCRAAVPFGPFPCAPDSREGRCARNFTNPDTRDRWYTSLPTRDDLHTYYYGPERRAVRDNLRDAVKVHRSAAGDADVLDDIDPPTRQTRRSTWAGDWWD